MYRMQGYGTPERRSLLGLLAVLTLFSSGPATADGGYVTPSIGAYRHQSAQDLDGSLLLGLGVGYQWADFFRAEVTYLNLDTEPKNPSVLRSVDISHWRLDGQIGLGMIGRWQPYLSAGLGHSRINPQTSAVDSQSYWSAGLGALYVVDDRFHLRSDLRYQRLDMMGGNALDNLSVSLGANLFFDLFASAKPTQAVLLSVKDSDGDGVGDQRDTCPGTLALIKVDSKGCVADGDQDGVADYRDFCPQTVAGAVVDGRGCVTDQDGDGVDNPRDQCADTPLGLAVNSQGCPARDRDSDRDGDGDGVVDQKDQCPETPQNYQVDNRGCSSLTDQKHQIALQVRFKSGRAEIDDAYVAEIAKVADFMQRFSETNVIFEGHTDSLGDAQGNLSLSAARAASVAKYLQEHYQIDAARIASKGYGESQPIADNNSYSGRSQNRRVVAVLSATSQQAACKPGSSCY